MKKKLCIFYVMIATVEERNELGWGVAVSTVVGDNMVDAYPMSEKRETLQTLLEFPQLVE